MAASLKPRHPIRELVARLLDRPSRDVVPGRASRDGPSGMNQQRRVRWSEDSAPDNGASIVGSPRYIHDKLVAYQAHGLGQRETGRSGRQCEPSLRSGEIANPEQSDTRVQATSLRSSKSTWADKWRR